MLGQMSSIVSCKRILNGGKESVLAAVADAMNLAYATKSIRGNAVFIKVNLMSTQVVPGTCTSPWVFEGTVKALRENYADLQVFFGDADAYGIERSEEAARSWGLIDVAKKYDARFINLSKISSVKQYLGETLGTVDLPSLLFDIDSLITIPVIKTHYLTVFTGSLKNQWGLLPNVRYKFHPVFSEAICEVNRLFKEKLFVVADMTVGQEGLGPRMGNPVTMNMVLAGRDPVAVDSAACSIIGLPTEKVPYLKLGERNNVGSMSFEFKGDEPDTYKFHLAKLNRSSLLGMRERLKEIPLVKSLILNTFAYSLQARLGQFYVKRWYETRGSTFLEQYSKNGFYAEEFSELLRRNLTL
jgi:uncharacterized protein (DUF362 family)